MACLVVVLVAFAASGLTFFSGFGLGTLLLPAFALFFPAEHAVSLTAAGALPQRPVQARSRRPPRRSRRRRAVWRAGHRRLVRRGERVLRWPVRHSGRAAVRVPREDGPVQGGVRATSVVVASLVDVSRLGVYWRALARESLGIDYALLAGAVLAAFAGALVGNRFLRTVTMEGVRRIVAAMLLLVSLGLVGNVL